MRLFLLFIGILVGLFILNKTRKAMAETKSDEQPYKVVRTGKDLEIRFYPSVSMAMINSSASSYKELAGSGFRILAGYIFGGNDRKQKIAMTSPVHMDINNSMSSMSFVMPALFTKDNLPKPKNENVIIKTAPEEYVAAIRFGGYASDKDIKLYSGRLESALKASAIEYYGNFRFLGYNAPYQFFCRRNEIIVSIRWSSKKINKT